LQRAGDDGRYRSRGGAPSARPEQELDAMIRTTRRVAVLLALAAALGGCISIF
jgi:hypothetical protein